MNLQPLTWSVILSPKACKKIIYLKRLLISGKNKLLLLPKIQEWTLSIPLTKPQKKLFRKLVLKLKRSRWWKKRRKNLLLLKPQPSSQRIRSSLKTNKRLRTWRPSSRVIWMASTRRPSPFSTLKRLPTKWLSSARMSLRGRSAKCLSTTCQRPLSHHTFSRGHQPPLPARKRYPVRSSRLWTTTNRWKN